MSEYELRCDGCFKPIGPTQARIYTGWRFTGTASNPPRRGGTTHAMIECQRSYLWTRQWERRHAFV